MDSETLQNYFENSANAAEWLRGFGFVDLARGHRNLVALAAHLPEGNVRVAWFELLSQLTRWTADPDMVINNLERFFASTATHAISIWERLQNPQQLSTLLEIFSTSQYLSDILIREPVLFESVRASEGKALPRTTLIQELLQELLPLNKDDEIVRCLRRFKHRHILRIAYGDIIRRQSLEIVTEQISDLADACVEGALRVAGRRLFSRRGTPQTQYHDIARFTVLALGKLGGRELNYSSDIDLIFLYDAEGTTDTAAITNSQYFAELGREIVRLLSDATELGFAYRVDMRLRPNGHHAPLAIGFDEAMHYYDSRGRTWERQAFIKARPIAGNMGLGEEFLGHLQYWVYQPYLGQMDISAIRSLKRKIERQAVEDGEGTHNVKTGRGGIRDIEFAIQFLQLINGCALPSVRSRNTLDAIAKLERAGCLSHQESTIFSEGYKFLRKVEHRLQMMFDLQTHTLPTSEEELRKLAFRMGYARATDSSPLSQFMQEYQRKTELNRRILDHLFHGAFRRDLQMIEVDLIFDPDPAPEMIEKVLRPYRFRDIQQAYHNLIDLAEERVRYLSSRRSRHFLASIAPFLLSVIATTPDPDQTLATLASVSDALGGKAGLWELFSFNPPSLRLYVRLCAFAPYLTDMLKRDPGMLDSLMDSLVRDQLPRREHLDTQLQYLIGGADDIDPILHSFKNDSVLCVGVREILSKSDIRESTATLSDIAQVCLKHITLREYADLVRRFGEPSVEGRLCRFAIVALGKFGGYEINYHSDLDLLFLYETEGETILKPLMPHTLNATEDVLGTRRMIDNQTFFDMLVQQILKRTSSAGVMGKLYEVDTRLRPMGKQGRLAVQLNDFVRYFTEGRGELWERQMLCRARVIFTFDESTSFMGTVCDLKTNRTTPSSMRRLSHEAITLAQYAHAWEPTCAAQINTMRQRMQEADPEDRLKRGAGGLVDIEFLVQMLQLKYGKKHAGIRNTNTPYALEKLYATGIISAKQRDILREHYRFLRTIESGLRLLNCESTTQLPQEDNLTRLAVMVGATSSEDLESQVETITQEVRAIYDEIFTREKQW